MVELTHMGGDGKTGMMPVPDRQSLESYVNGPKQDKQVNVLPRQFQSLNELLETGKFHMDYRSALEDGDFVRTAVYNLQDTNPYLDEFKTFLSEVNPNLCARYLVAAYQRTAQRGPAKDVMVGYSASLVTFVPLLAVLGKGDSDEPGASDAAKAAEETLIAYGGKVLPFLKLEDRKGRLRDALTKVRNQILKNMILG
ncbi:hypothetical protein HYU40_02645 [Candidatus Woesearchaeota archaeon]|nr:hypothetical protein [Candidatus Woesearchaeota archaeon]